MLPWGDIITFLGLLVVILNAILQQPIITPDLTQIITFAILVLNGLIVLLRYFFPENATLKALRR